jgi:hypothetical protein
MHVIGLPYEAVHALKVYKCIKLHLIFESKFISHEQNIYKIFN